MPSADVLASVTLEKAAREPEMLSAEAAFSVTPSEYDPPAPDHV